MKERISSQRHTLFVSGASGTHETLVGFSPGSDGVGQALNFVEELVSSPEQKWRDKIVCHQTDPEAFFPEIGHSTKSAKIICGLCVSVEPCLEGALERREEFGVWGGKSFNEREAILKLRDAAQGE